VNSQRHDEHPGFLFVLEGIDGAGKTAVVESLVELLSRNYDVVRLREPTNESQWGLEIRERSPKGELTYSILTDNGMLRIGFVPRLRLANLC